MSRSLVAAPWPAADAPLVAVDGPSIQGKTGPIRVAVDPGHGAPGNTGNKDVLCRDEADHMLRIADALVARLGTDRRFVVKQLRSGDARPTYRARVASAKAFRAEVIVSLHSDARGAAEWWVPDPSRPERACLRNDAAPGIAVLFSDEGPARLVEQRRKVARGLLRRLSTTGFPPYLGADYTTLYRFDDVPGAYIDDRPKKQRVFLLRQQAIPTVIVETHHALDLAENARWQESRTFDAFAAAVAAGLVDALRVPVSK